jgi:thioredoxin reductase/polyferredoxin
MLKRLGEKLQSILSSGDMPQRRPALRKHNESSVAGLYIIGDLAGAPVIKLAMAQGFEVVQHIAAKPDARSNDSNTYDLLIVGAGAAGLNAALAARDRGLRAVVLEKGKVANTIEDFPEGKWVYAEPDQSPPKGKLWLDGARKEDLLRRWHQIVRDNQLDVRTEEGLQSLEKLKDGTFRALSTKADYRTRRVVLATGQRGNPRKLGVPGEDLETVYHRLYSPRHYKNEDILVVGGGNSAVEAALVLSEQNRVRLSYRGSELSRIFKDNERKLNQAVAARRVELLLNSNVKEFRGKQARIVVDRGGHQEEVTLPCDHAFVLIGAELPVKFLQSLGIRLENEWSGSFLRAAALSLLALVGLWFYGGHATTAWGIPFGSVPSWAGALLALAGLFALVATGIRADRYAWLGLSFLVWYAIYGIKSPGPGAEFWPFRGWGFQATSFFGRPTTFWYTVMYTLLMTGFGFQAMKRWGIGRKDRFQIWRYVSLLGFQWTFFFLIPEFLFQWAIKYQWVGERLAGDPTFADQAWRSYGLVYAWPLFFYQFFYDPHKIWVIWGVALTFVIIPIFVLFFGKRYCSWICGCGGLAETFGDRWRHLAPKGRASLRWEWMQLAILLAAAGITGMMLLRDTVAVFRNPAAWGLNAYHLYVDIWLVGILPVTLYPFLGGKVWCRYWCPLAKLMHLFSAAYTRLGISRFQIVANDKCIGCSECSRNCQVGIDVMHFALRQAPLNNANSSCIGCGICVSVCPMDTLSFGVAKPHAALVQIGKAVPSVPA